MGRKPKKKSKKQLEEELQRAAEEQKKQEEQERVVKEEEDAVAAEAARVKQEQLDQELAREAERLAEESSTVGRMKAQARKDLDYEQSKLQDRINWQKFVACDTRPNVMFENDINTYMTLVREDRTKQLEEALQKCRDSEESAWDLVEHWCKAKETGDVAHQEWCRSYIHRLRALELEVLDGAFAHFLQYLERQVQEGQSQVSLAWGSRGDDVKLGFWASLEKKGFKPRTVEHPEIQISLELPKSFTLLQQTQQAASGQFVGVRTVYTAFDSCAGKDPSQMPVGGMVHVDLLCIPHFTTKAKTWTLRQIPPPGQELKRLAFPGDEAQREAMAAQACKLEYKVPGHVMVQKNPTVSWWNRDHCKWSVEGISEVSWEPEERTISFLTTRLAAFSITQERHLDLPFKYWSLRPVGFLEAELSLQAARYALKFVITEDGLRLKGPELPELRGVMYTYAADGGGPEDMRRAEHPGAAPRGREGEVLLSPRQQYDAKGERVPRVRSPATLLKELRDSGLNLMPEDDDADFLEGYSPKDLETQARAYSDLSEIAGCFDIASSRHNKDLPQDRAMVRVRENALGEEFDPLDPDCDADYQAVLFYRDKSCFSPSLEQQPLNMDIKPGHETHASLFICFERAPDPPAHQAEMLQQLEVNCVNVRFVEAVRQTMQLLRLLCFS